MIICHLCGTIKRVESDCFILAYKKVEIKKKITIKIIVSLVILKSNPPKYKENSGKISNCSKGLKKIIFFIIFKNELRTPPVYSKE
jgi:hypothetical protein